MSIGLNANNYFNGEPLLNDATNFWGEYNLNWENLREFKAEKSFKTDNTNTNLGKGNVLKNKIKTTYNLPSFACGATGPSDDFDCDGIINSEDLDDDNDGILDDVECGVSPPLDLVNATLLINGSAPSIAIVPMSVNDVLLFQDVSVTSGGTPLDLRVTINGITSGLNYHLVLN